MPISTIREICLNLVQKQKQLQWGVIRVISDTFCDEKWLNNSIIGTLTQIRELKLFTFSAKSFNLSDNSKYAETSLKKS